MNPGFDLEQQIFLLFGHSFKGKEDHDAVIKLDHQPTKAIEISFLISRAKEVWLGSIERLLQDNAKVVVPLSGGLDSRLILASLLEFLPASEITTFTFGSKGSLDFEIGKKVAKAAGTRHIDAHINPYSYSLESETKWCQMIKGSTCLFYHPPLEIIDDLKDYQYWIGYMGDPLAGSHLDTRVNNRASALEAYVKKFSCMSDDIASSQGFDIPAIKEALKAEANWHNAYNPFECIDFSIRQKHYIASHILYSGKTALPFMQSEWVNFMMNLPIELRKNQAFFRQFMVETYPTLFKLPCKNNFGYPLGSRWYKLRKIKWRLFPSTTAEMLNYINFDSEIRAKGHFYNLLREIFFDFQSDSYFGKEDLEHYLSEFEKGKLSHVFLLHLASNRLRMSLEG